MKVLFFQWISFMNEGVERAFQKMEISYDIFFYQPDDWEKDDGFSERFAEKLKEGYDAVFSLDYMPLISDACEKLGVRYVAWVYDSPLHIRNLSSLKNHCNEIYFFDRGQAEEYRRQGIDARHMPLAVDTEFWREQIKKYGDGVPLMEISFVGKLYHTEYSYFTSVLSEYLRGYLEGLVKSQGKLYGGYIIPEVVSDELLGRMNEEYAKVATDGFQMRKRELEFLLAEETTYRERRMIIMLLAKHWKLDWYTGDTDEIPRVNRHPYADYRTVMPTVFHQSKINLNISLKTIRTGIPLRALDIMGCGGFLLSNYQEELAEYFVPDQECVLYESMEDLYEKAAYYMAHDGERQRIARAGQEKVEREFTFDGFLKKML